MSCIRILALSLAGVAVGLPLIPSPAVGQKHGDVKSEFTSITGPDSVFQVKYPKFLVRCERRDGENPDVWSPEGNCMASIPACDSSGHSGNVLACLAYPTGEFKGSELQAAAFAVSRLESFHTAKECLLVSRDVSGIHEERIGGVKFQVAHAIETQASYVAEHSIYRTFHNSVCYELDVNLSIALDSAFAAEDAPRKLTSAEREKIKAGLTQALQGFRFLK